MSCWCCEKDLAKSAVNKVMRMLRLELMFNTVEFTVDSKKERLQCPAPESLSLRSH